MLEVAFTNTPTIYRKLHPGLRTDRNRIGLKIINELTIDYRKGRQIADLLQSELWFTYSPGMYMPVFVTSTTPSGKLHYPDCIVCSEQNKAGESSHNTVQYLQSPSLPSSMYGKIPYHAQGDI